MFFIYFILLSAACINFCMHAATYHNIIMFNLIIPDIVYIVYILLRQLQYKHNHKYCESKRKSEYQTLINNHKNQNMITSDVEKRQKEENEIDCK